jgi:hypothetical protein
MYNKIKILAIVIIVLVLSSCNINSKKNNDQKITEVVKENPYESQGYALMQQKCLICHFEKPDPTKKDAMIAPPMLRVQEHYKPSYPDKEKFVQAVTQWVLNPDESKTLMPGTIRKFNLMPKLPYEEKDIKLIAETLYDIDFGKMDVKKMMLNQKMSLNNGKKWIVNNNTVSKINAIKDKLNTFNSNDVKTYNKLGSEVFDNAKTILLDKSYSEDLFNQLHLFFNNIEGNIHLLIGANSIEEAQKQQEILKKKLTKFNDFFTTKN